MKPKETKEIKSLVTPMELARLEGIIKDSDFVGSPDDVKRQFIKMAKEYAKGEYLEDAKKVLLADQLISLNNLDNHILLSTTTEPIYLTFIVQFAKDLTSEYNCQTASEKALAQTIAEAYGRVLKFSKYLGMNINRENYSDLTILREKALSKDLDRAHRQYLSALQMLRQMKAPALNIHVKTQNAYIAQNQQNIDSQPSADDSIERQ